MHVWGGQYQGRDTALQAIRKPSRRRGDHHPGPLVPSTTALAAPPADPQPTIASCAQLRSRSGRRRRASAIDQYEAPRLDPAHPCPAAVRVRLFLDWVEYPACRRRPSVRGLTRGSALQQDSAAATRGWPGFLLSFRNPRTFAV